MAQKKILLSACLAGINCVYDGSNKRHPVFAEMHSQKQAVVFCPEVLAGLKIPHPPSEILGGDGFGVLEGRARVVSKDGIDVSRYFLIGAKLSLALAKRLKIAQAILKSKSPSCGCGRIYDGTFSKKLVRGYGVTAALLVKNGIDAKSDAQYLKTIKSSARQKSRAIR